MTDKPMIDLAPLFDDICYGKITLSELEDKLDEYSKQVDEDAISLCFKGIPLYKSKHLVSEGV